jgi:hypothetical protein
MEAPTGLKGCSPEAFHVLSSGFSSADLALIFQSDNPSYPVLTASSIDQIFIPNKRIIPWDFVAVRKACKAPQVGDIN